jgi:hypothetical protein
MAHNIFTAREEVVYIKQIVIAVNKMITQMEINKTGAACD